MPTNQSIKSALDIILDWSQGQPAWQRDALRRIIVNGAVKDEDISDLIALCKKEHGVTSITLTAKPLSRADLPASPGAKESISLSSISGVEGVNQLAPNQELLFGHAGLTIIYGDNGAGKSGYARVLKRACRARFPGEIMPDAYDKASPKIATAALGYLRGGKEKPAVQWSDDEHPHPILSAVNVFDRDCGSIHVRQKNEVAFRPFGLDVPDELASACQRMKIALTTEQTSLQSARDPVFTKSTWKPNTEVGRILASLTAFTKLDRLEALAKMTSQEINRFERLVEDLAKDPVKASSEQALFADELRALAAQLTEAEALARDEPLNSIQSLHDSAQGKRKAAILAASRTFELSTLGGVGEVAWRTLWEAARSYSEQVAYCGADFPPTSADKLCVLCQQPLSADAQKRLTSFETFVQSDVERRAQEAERAFASALTAFDRRKVSLRGAARRKIAIADAGLGKEILRFMACARLRRIICRRTVEKGDRKDFPVLPNNPAARVQTLENAIREYAQELLQAADLTARARLEAERDELADRIALQTLLDTARAEVARLQAIHLLALCLNDTGTTPVTRLGNSIADEVVTTKMRDRFQEEIVRLAADKVRVEIVRVGGKYGSPVYQVKLFANKDAPVHIVLSEGEQTCVALAAFLTELATAPHQSALVFDDPVSSLDHRWRNKVAQRLVEEASLRQIIVFTHDLVFVNDLNDHAEHAKVPVKFVSLSRGPAGAGLVTQGLPWMAASVRDRVDKMEKDVRTAKSLYDRNDETAYNAEVHRIYSNLRSTWERAIEDVAFNGVISRHRDFVNTKHLRKATVLSSADVDAFDNGFQKCCDLTDAHDGSRGRNDALPPPQEMLKDVQAVRTWADDIRERQKKIE